MPGDDDDDLDAVAVAESEAAGEQPDAANPKLAAEQRKRNETYARRRETFWRNVLADPVGRKEIWDIIGVECHAFEIKRACGPNGFPDDNGTQAATAEQLLGQRLYQTLQMVDFEGAWLMLAEHDSRFPKPKRKP